MYCKEYKEKYVCCISHISVKLTATDFVTDLLSDVQFSHAFQIYSCHPLLINQQKTQTCTLSLIFLQILQDAVFNKQKNLRDPQQSIFKVSHSAEEGSILLEWTPSPLSSYTDLLYLTLWTSHTPLHPQMMECNWQVVPTRWHAQHPDIDYISVVSWYAVSLARGVSQGAILGPLIFFLKPKTLAVMHSVGFSTIAMPMTSGFSCHFPTQQTFCLAGWHLEVDVKTPTKAQYGQDHTDSTAVVQTLTGKSEPGSQTVILCKHYIRFGFAPSLLIWWPWCLTRCCHFLCRLM